MSDHTRAGLTIGVAAYNEGDSVIHTVQEILRGLEELAVEAEILVLDDASTDGTEAFCRKAEQLSPLVRVRRNPRNLGFGGTYLHGAVLASHPWYLMLPGDNAFDAASIRRLCQALGQADMVVSYVTNPGIRSLMRRMLSRTFTGLMNAITGRHLRYYNGPVIHRTASIRTLPHVTHSFAFQAEILCRLFDHGASMVEVPVQLRESETRKSTALRWRNLVGVAATLVRLAFRRAHPGIAGAPASSCEVP